jgi:uncharacterized membrane protein SpoIIM required for sporulation
MGTPSGAPLGLKHVIIIFANNLVPVVVCFSFPPLIAAYNLFFAKRHPEKYSKEVKPLIGDSLRLAKDRLSSELFFNLTAFGFALAFALGFFVFGVFSGYLMRTGGLPLLYRGFRIISLHAPFEVTALLMSASVALGIRDTLLHKSEVEPRKATELARTLGKLVKSREMASSLGLVILLIMIGAFVEVYVSAPLARRDVFYELAICLKA